MDQFWGGRNDITATGGFEENGVTTIIFRKKLSSDDVADHDITDNLMHVIWARGQEKGKYVHSPPSGLEKEMASMQEFYAPDELKYHGHKQQRGFTQINFFDSEKKSRIQTESGSSNLLDDDCKGHWSHPRSCDPKKLNCEYYASWKTVGRGDEIRFKVQTNATATWTGIAFSENEKMSQTDAIIGWIDQNGLPFVMDTWINGYMSPKLDGNQDVYNISGRLENGVTVLEFTRKRATDDPKDLSFTDDHCLYLMFPVTGGRFNAVNKKMTKHEQTPVVTDAKVCIKSCGLELLIESDEPEVKEPPKMTYAVSVKLQNLAESFVSPPKGSPEFASLASQISQSMASVLSQIPGYTETDVDSFVQ